MDYDNPNGDDTTTHKIDTNTKKNALWSVWPTVWGLYFFYLILCAQLNNRLAKIQFRINVSHRLQLHEIVIQFEFGQTRKNRFVPTIRYCLD